MTNIPKMREFAANNRLSLTGDLNHIEVEELGKNNFPKEIRFHEKELFHSLSLADHLKHSRDQGPPIQNLGLNMPLIVCKRGFRGIITSSTVFAPVVPESYDEDGDLIYAVRPLTDNEKPGFCPTFSEDEISINSRFTNIPDGPEIPFMNANFGSQRYVAGPETDFQIPRFPISITAEFRMLLETLKHNLLAHLEPGYPRETNLEPGYPIETNIDFTSPLHDALIGNFIFGETEEDYRNLLALIQAYENNNHGREDELLRTLKGIISPKQWELIKKTGFLEFYPIHSYNDFDRYQKYWRVGNDHEGDVEGFCLVFDRADLTPPENADDQERLNFINQAKPLFVITNAHTVTEDMDEIRKLETDEDYNKLYVWISGGSHAAHLKEGSFKVHTIWSRVEGSVLVGIASTFTFHILLLLLLLIDHLTGAEDEASSKGIHASASHNGGRDGQDDLIAIHTTPLSRDHNIYQDGIPGPDDPAMTLEERAFPGQWGRSEASDFLDNPFEVGNKSPSFGGKTKRFFHKLMSHPANR